MRKHNKILPGFNPLEAEEDEKRKLNSSEINNVLESF